MTTVRYETLEQLARWAHFSAGAEARLQCPQCRAPLSVLVVEARQSHSCPYCGYVCAAGIVLPDPATVFVKGPLMLTARLN